MLHDVFLQLRRLYKAHADIEITTDVNSHLALNLRSSAFTQYHRNGELLTHHSGISLSELMFLESFCRCVEPKNIFIIGNGMGWSTLGLSLINPHSRVVCIEPEVGIELTNSIAEAAGLDCKVVQGFSPQDNRAVISGHFAGLPDLVLVDALHDDINVRVDFDSLFEICGPGCSYVFHDVLMFGMVNAIEAIHQSVKHLEMTKWVLTSTSSGMAILAPGNIPERARELLSAFSASPEAIDALRRLARLRNMPPTDLIAPLGVS
jgi:predicted O-methyltransferase YrrM